MMTDYVIIFFLFAGLAMIVVGCAITWGAGGLLISTGAISTIAATVAAVETRR
jgi:hypothetical protein